MLACWSCRLDVPAHEHEGCGVGMVPSAVGQPVEVLAYIPVESFGLSRVHKSRRCVRGGVQFTTRSRSHCGIGAVAAFSHSKAAIALESLNLTRRQAAAFTLLSQRFLWR